MFQTILKRGNEEGKEQENKLLHIRKQFMRQAKKKRARGGM
jgi:hypothetical protein